jgi:hypothetical protein
LSRLFALLLVGGAAFALAAMMGATAVIAGALWIFVFGDDPWPEWVMAVLNLLIPLAGLFLWAVASWQIWQRLKPKARQP